MIRLSIILVSAILTLALTGCGTKVATGDQRNNTINRDSSFDWHDSSDIHREATSKISEGYVNESGKVSTIELPDGTKVSVSTRQASTTQPATTEVVIADDSIRRGATTQSTSTERIREKDGDAISTLDEIKVGGISTKHVTNNFLQRMPLILLCAGGVFVFLYFPVIRSVPTAIILASTAGILLVASDGLILYGCVGAVLMILLFKHVNLSNVFTQVVDSVRSARSAVQQKDPEAAKTIDTELEKKQDRSTQSRVAQTVAVLKAK